MNINNRMPVNFGTAIYTRVILNTPPEDETNYSEENEASDYFEKMPDINLTRYEEKQKLEQILNDLNENKYVYFSKSEEHPEFANTNDENRFLTLETDNRFTLLNMIDKENKSIDESTEFSLDKLTDKNKSLSSLYNKIITRLKLLRDSYYQ